MANKDIYNDMHGIYEHWITVAADVYAKLFGVTIIDANGDSLFTVANPGNVTGTVATGGLTDAQLRATPVPISGTVTAIGPQTDAEARATAQPVSVASQLGLAANVAEPGAAAAAVVTKVAVAGGANVIAQISWSLSEAPAAAVNLMIEDGVGTTIFSQDITSAGAGFAQWIPPKRGTVNTAMVITLASGAGTVVGKVSVHAWTE